MGTIRTPRSRFDKGGGAFVVSGSTVTGETPRYAEPGSPPSVSANPPLSAAGAAISATPAKQTMMHGAYCLARRIIVCLRLRRVVYWLRRARLEPGREVLRCANHRAILPAPRGTHTLRVGGKKP